MARDGFEESERGAVVHQAGAQADSPQRGGADFVAAALKILFREVRGHRLEDAMAVVLARGLQDAVAGADVVHQEISVRMQSNGSERGRNCVRAAIDFSSGGGGGERFDVARGA